MHEQLNELVSYLTNAQRIVFFTGAGVSTDSGIPDYRGPKGVWKTRSPVYYQDFMNDPEQRLAYWQQKVEDWDQFGAAEANNTHKALVALNEAGKLRCCVTQNIDGLHAKSGLPQDKLVEIHGTNLEAECQACGNRKDAAAYYVEMKDKGAYVPDCDLCDGFYKPATISFGQSLREADLEQAQDAMLDTDLVIALGTTLEVNPAASLPLFAARMGIPYVVINKGLTAHDGLPLVSLRIEGDLKEVFPPAVDMALAMQG